jgi:hypothetical protein
VEVAEAWEARAAELLDRQSGVEGRRTWSLWMLLMLLKCMRLTLAF